MITIDQHTRICKILTVLSRLAVRVTCQCYISHGIRANQIEEMQTSITAILSIRSCIVAEEVKNDVNKKENIDEG